MPLGTPRGPARGASRDAWEPVHDRAALAAALDPIITIDFFGVIRSASNSIEQVLGWRPGEIIGKNVSVLMPEPYRSAHDGYLARYRETGETKILNRPRRLVALHKDGSVIPVEVAVSRADVPGGDRALFVGIIRDMRGRAGEDAPGQAQLYELLAEQTAALQAAQARLQMADRMASIGTLAAGLGHDMNNVLFPVRARLNALRAAAERGRLTPEDRRHVEEIAHCVAYLQQLADGLHYLVEDPEQAERQDASSDLAQWWSRTGVLISKAVPRGVRVEGEIPAGLPKVPLAEHQITQAVLNLVVNAGEAVAARKGPAARVPGQVRVWARVCEGGEHVCLGVSDNGIGMSDEVRRRAFELFFTTKKRGWGTGLGLPLVRRVAARAGGSVEIDSHPGQGTTVTMVLPVVRGGRERER